MEAVPRIMMCCAATQNPTRQNAAVEHLRLILTCIEAMAGADFEHHLRVNRNLELDQEKPP